MSELSDAWTSIAVNPEEDGRTERRADPDHPLDFYRARDNQGKYQLILKCTGLQNLSPLPTLSGLTIRFSHTSGTSQELVIGLQDNEQVSIFRALCADILDATRDLESEDSAAAARRVLLRIERWQELLKRRREQLLSRQAIIGLVGELLFLRDYAFDLMQRHEAVASWRGPYGEEQDFGIGNTIVEIKTQLSTADQYLKISSEAQLDSTSGSIVICHQTLASGTAGSSNSARTLNELVAEIRNLILESNPASLDLFEASLMAAAYDVREEYDEESWVPVSLRIFEVCDTFPRLVPDNIPAGIQAVSYRILPNACSEFERDETWLREVVFG